MLFNVEVDSGSELIGYLVPDSFSNTADLAAIGHGQVLWTGTTSEPRDALVTSGRHATGLCGFRIGPNEVPGLPELGDLELRDLGTGLTFYRRAWGRSLVEGHFFRLETRLLPLRNLDLELEPHFQVWHSNAEHLSAETINQLFLLHGVSSSFSSGRVNVPAHSGLTDGSVQVMALLRDPFEELAERLIALSGAFGGADRFLTARERIALHPALEALDQVDTLDPRTLRRFFRKVDPSVAAALSNPLTRQLSATTPGDLCAPGAVAAALRALSGFDVVAINEMPGYFEAALGALLEIAPPRPAQTLRGSAVTEIADQLAAISTVEALLECDLEVYASASGVFERLAVGTAQG